MRSHSCACAPHAIQTNGFRCLRPACRLDEFLPQDFAMQNHYIKENPLSHFRTNLVVARQTTEGRVTLLNDSFRVWREGEAAPAEEQTVEGEQALLAVLGEHFGISLPA